MFNFSVVCYGEVVDRSESEMGHKPDSVPPALSGEQNSSNPLGKARTYVFESQPIMITGQRQRIKQPRNNTVQNFKANIQIP